jgi:hypothetical protein
MRKLMVLALLGAALYFSAAATVFGDGTDPMPACRNPKNCPQLADAGR